MGEQSGVYDVVVVGGGPAGAAAALAARREGATVLLLDRFDFPRDKTCGDGIAADALDVLAGLGVTGAVDGYEPVRKLRLVAPSGAEVARALPRIAHTVPRRVFDARLVAATVAAGVELKRHAVKVVRDDGELVRVDDFAGRVVIGADGAGSVVRRSLGFAGNPPGHLAIAMRGYAAAVGDEQLILTSRARWPAYAWSFPIGDGTANVGYGEVLRGTALTKAYLIGRLRELLPGSEPTGLRAHHLPLSTHRPAPGRGRVLLAGDALSLINPFTGEGIFYAVLSGSLAGLAAAAGPSGSRSGMRPLSASAWGGICGIPGSPPGSPAGPVWSTPRCGRRGGMGRFLTGWWTSASVTGFSTFARSGGSGHRCSISPRRPLEPGRVLDRLARMSVRSLVYSLYERRLAGKLAGRPVPRHVGVMCDGNRRWAREMGYVDPNDGHRVGAVRIKELLGWCDAAGIEHVTLYLLATDNLQRPSAELDPLVKIIEDLATELAEDGNPWRLRIVGALDILPATTATALKAAQEKTRDRTEGVEVNMAVGYGGRREITDAVRSLLYEQSAQGRTLEELAEILDVEHIAEHLYTRGQPDPDLVIRTSGEQRLSGFLLWQSAHSEFYFHDANWPDFRRTDFLRALRSYAGRQRRYGA